MIGALRSWHGPGGGEEARLRIALHLDPDIAATLEIVIDGLDADAVASAMRAGLAAIIKLGAKRGATRVGAGNYGGKLGPHHFHLKDLGR